MIGSPEMSFTLKSDPDKLSVRLNSSPCDPCTVNIGCADPDPTTISR